MKSEGETGYGEKHRLADNPGSLPGVLARLACDDDCHVAENPNVTVELSERLASDNEHVRAGVAGSPHTPVELLWQLSEDDASLVRAYVARNPTTPGALLTRLSEDKSFLDVRSGVARNPNTPRETLDKLSRNTQPSVLRSLAHNPSTPVGILARLTRRNSQGVRIDAKREFTQRQNSGKVYG